MPDDKPTLKPILRTTVAKADQYDVYAIVPASSQGCPLAIVGTEQAAADWLRIYNMNRDDSEVAMWIGYNLDGR